MTLCIGLTGGIGSGKSTVAQLFAKHGAAIIDTDQISHQLTAIRGAGIPPIRIAFGNDFITNDGALNRPKMRNLIFSDPLAKKKLEQILHPLILCEVNLQLRRLNTCPYIILIVPLLFDSPPFQALVDRILVVDCSEEIQIARVTTRDGFSIQLAKNIIQQQTPATYRLKFADDVILNNGELSDLDSRVTLLHKQYSLS